MTEVCQARNYQLPFRRHMSFIPFHSLSDLLNRNLSLNHSHNLLCLSDYLTKSSKQRLSIFRLNSI